MPGSRRLKFALSAALVVTGAGTFSGLAFAEATEAEAEPSRSRSRSDTRKRPDKRARSRAPRRSDGTKVPRKRKLPALRTRDDGGRTPPPRRGGMRQDEAPAEPHPFQNLVAPAHAELTAHKLSDGDVWMELHNATITILTGDTLDPVIVSKDSVDIGYPAAAAGGADLSVHCKGNFPANTTVYVQAGIFFIVSHWDSMVYPTKRDKLKFLVETEGYAEYASILPLMIKLIPPEGKHLEVSSCKIDKL